MLGPEMLCDLRGNSDARRPTTSAKAKTAMAIAQSTDLD